MTDSEMTAITEGFKHLNDRISDLEAKVNNINKEPDVPKKDDGMKFEELPPEMKTVEGDKSAQIKESWFDKKLF